MAGAPQQQESGKDNSYFILWVIFLIVFVGFIIWYFAAHQLKIFFIYARKFEFTAIYYSIAWIPSQLIPGLADLVTRVQGDIRALQNITPANITPEIAKILSEELGNILKWPLSVLMAGLAFYIYKSHLHLRFVQKHSMQSLVAQEYTIWPQIKIVRNLNLLDQDLDSGPWAMAMTPLQFGKKYKLVAITVAEMTGSGFSKTPEAEFKILIDKVRTERVFAAQLGRPFTGLNNLPAHRKALAAIFIARSCRDTKTAQSMVYQLANSAGDGKLDYSGIDSLLKKYSHDKKIERICQSHAYELTVLASLLLAAREDGVLASADFLWIKPMDRRLWYVINNVGRQTPAAEVAGIFCHWYYELALKKPLSSPVVDNAVTAFELAMGDVLYVPDENERAEIFKAHQEQQQRSLAQSTADSETTQASGTL